MTVLLEYILVTALLEYSLDHYFCKFVAEKVVRAALGSRPV